MYLANIARGSLRQVPSGRSGRTMKFKFFHLCRQVDGKWYATITARSEGADPIIAIAGPFADLEEATAHNAECMEKTHRDRQLYAVDMNSVPPKARQGITDEVLRVWRQGDFERYLSQSSARDHEPASAPAPNWWRRWWSSG